MKSPRCCRLLAFALLLSGAGAVFAQPYAFTTPVGAATNPGKADGTNGQAQFTAPTGLALDNSGTISVLDGNSLRRVSPLGTNWVVLTVAGSVGLHAFLDGTNAAARFNFPQGVACDTAGNLYVADTGNNAIRKVSLVGTNWVVTTIAGPTPPNNSFGAADGTNESARFHNPYGIAVDSATNLYVADTVNDTIRRVSPVGTNWVVTTLAGLANSPGSANGSNDVARFSNPSSVAVDASGALFVSDYANNMIRKLTPLGTNWAVTTLAGSTNAGAADGLGAAAGFNAPQCVAVDSAGNLFVSDSGNFTIRRITPAGWVTTVAGLAGIPGSADGIGSAARFVQPFGVALASSGTVFVADYLGYSLREGQLAPVLRIMPAGAQVVVSWPTGLTGFLLQARADLRGAPWNTISTGFTQVEDYFYLTNQVEIGGGFYRLYKPGP